MAKKAPKLQIYVVSVDFDTKAKRRLKSPYYQLRKRLKSLGVVVATTHQIKLLLTWYSAKHVRDQIRRIILLKSDRIYVAKIARGSAWHRPLGISNQHLKEVLKAHAGGVGPTVQQVQAARKTIKGLFPLQAG